MPKFVDISGQQFGEWTVLEYEGSSKWLCQCSCGAYASVLGKTLRNGTSKSCGHDTNKSKVAPGMKFNNWVVLKKATRNSYWICECQCDKHTLSEVASYDLTHNKSTNCGCVRKMKMAQRNSENREILEGMQFGEWKVLRYIGNKHYECKCSCGKIKNVSSRDLKSGISKSCGHNNNKDKLIDITGQQFGNWRVLKYLGDKKYRCLCCKCNTEWDVWSSLLKNGGSTQCRNCRTKQLMSNTLTRVKSSQMYGKDRNNEQLLAVQSKENFVNFINNHNIEKITVFELAELLNISVSIVHKYLHRYNMWHIIDNNSSKYEIMIKDEIKRIDPKMNIISRDRTVLKGKELDIYIPEKKLAIEFNGNYWHSNQILQNKRYHQDKTLECLSQNIRLIHIFEYEWNDIEKRNKILKLLNKEISTNKNIIYGRSTDVKVINNADAKNFLELYHLQNSCNASINIGCYYEQELIGVMTFGMPRFDKNAQYEILRLAWNSNYAVIGGTEKMFKCFVSKYNPESVITYVDISKFSGMCYINLGFKKHQDNFITEPNYKWVHAYENYVLSRYQTQKNILIKNGLCTDDDTEDSTMERAGFLKIYDSGNAKFIWEKGDI